VTFVDPQKRASFDQHGSDPESRFNGMASGSNVHPFGNGSPFAGGEMTAEELFNMFFSESPGMGFGGPFGGGPGMITQSLLSSMAI
jgi:DnaJ family protein B protein 12